MVYVMDPNNSVIKRLWCHLYFTEQFGRENTAVKTPLTGHAGASRSYGTVPGSIGTVFTLSTVILCINP